MHDVCLTGIQVLAIGIWMLVNQCGVRKLKASLHHGFAAEEREFDNIDRKLDSIHAETAKALMDFGLQGQNG
jgi:hypothetical protein